MMKELNKPSKKIMEWLIAKLECGYLKIDNAHGTFMPLVIEKVSDQPGFTAVYSLAHYGEQNGDLMADPDMTFGLKDGNFYPLTFQNDYVGIYQEVMDKPVNLKLQQELAEFADMWLQNVIDQQSIKL